MILWIIAAICAFFIKGLCGFANTLVFTSILSFGVNNASISPVELLLGYPGNLLLAWKERKKINWKICGSLSALVMLGSIPGAFFLKNADTTVIKMIFGIVIILIGAEMLLRDFIHVRETIEWFYHFNWCIVRNSLWPLRSRSVTWSIP